MLDCVRLRKCQYIFLKKEKRKISVENLKTLRSLLLKTDLINVYMFCSLVVYMFSPCSVFVGRNRSMLLQVSHSSAMGHVLKGHDT